MRATLLGETLAFTDNQKMFAYYVTAAVESDFDYACCNKVDAITVGITQWWGYHAKRLMAKMKGEAPDAFALLSEKNRDMVDNMRDDDWTRYFLTDTDVAGWQKAAALKECKKCQDELFLADAFGPGSMSNGDANYTTALSQWGISDSDVKTWIYWMTIYHQTPARCLRGIQAIGQSDIDTIFQWTRSDYVLSKYYNREKRVHDLLKSWDGQSAPPNFGQVVDTPTTGDPSGAIRGDSLQNQISYVEAVGNDLIIHGKVVKSDELLCHNTGRGIWLPWSGTNTPNPGMGKPDTGNTPSASPDDPKDFPAMRQLWYDNANKWGYSQGAGRLDPPSSGYSDCSACIYWAANKATNGKYSWMGTYTDAMRDNCHIVYETSSRRLPLDVLRPGDLIIMDYGGDGVTDHVEWYFGNGVVWGAGRSPLPHHTSDDVTTFLETFSKRLAHVWIARFLD